MLKLCKLCFITNVLYDIEKKGRLQDPQIFESLWLSMSTKDSKWLELLMLFKVYVWLCRSFSKISTQLIENMHLFHMEYVGLQRIPNFIFNFTQCLKVQCRNLFKTLPWSFSVKTHLYANYTVQCTPESVLLCIFPKPQQNS